MQNGMHKPQQTRELTDFGIWVKKRLVDKQMTSVELCRQLGCHEVYLSRIIHGDTSGKKYVIPLIEALGGDPKRFKL